MFHVELKEGIDYKLISNNRGQMQRGCAAREEERTLGCCYKSVLFQIKHAFKVHQKENYIKGVEHRRVH